MLITEIRATPVSIPATRTCAWSLGRGFGMSRTIVEVATSSGVVGLGETAGGAAAVIIEHELAPRLIGQPALEHATLQRACLSEHHDFAGLARPELWHAFSAIDMASWDLKGKSLELPLYRVLGGAVRIRAPFVAYAYTVDLADGHRERDVPELLATIAAGSIQSSGAAMFEFKVGRHSLDCDIETVLAVRKALGKSIDIGVDANMSMSLDRARKFLRGTAEAALANIEEPTATLVDMESLGRSFDVPVSTHCTDLEKIRHYPGIEGVVADLNVDGGISGILRLASAARAVGKRIWLRSSQEAGVSWAAMCHLGIALQELDRPGQTLIDWMEDDLVDGDPWSVRDGGVVPPDTPGLGVSLDRRAVERYATLYRERGELTYYDAR